MANRSPNDLTNTHEEERKLPWKISDAPQDFIDNLIGAIVGKEIPISKLPGKWKLGQNRSEADKLGIIAGEMSTCDPQSHAFASQLNQYTQINGK